MVFGIPNVLAIFGIGISLLAITFVLNWLGHLSVILHLFDWIKSGFNWTITTAPRFMQMLIFLFLILIFGNIVMGFILGSAFICNTDNVLHSPNIPLVGGIIFQLQAVFLPNETGAYDTFVSQRAIPTKEPDSTEAEFIITAKCLQQEPRLVLFGSLDFLDFRLWVLILIIGLFVKGMATLNRA